MWETQVVFSLWLSLWLCLSLFALQLFAPGILDTTSLFFILELMLSLVFFFKLNDIQHIFNELHFLFFTSPIV